MSVFDNIAFGLRVRPRATRPTEAEIKKRVTRLLDLVQLGFLADRYPAQLSGGQRQAVSLLMATLRPMKILLLDEHTAALDPRTAAFVLDLTRALVAERRLTTLMVTHNLRQALDIGDRTVMLHQGQVVFDISGTERTQLDVPDLLRLFSESQGGAVTDDELLLG